MCCNLDEVPEIHFVDEQGFRVYEGEFTILGVSLRQWSFGRDDITFTVRERNDGDA